MYEEYKQQQDFAMAVNGNPSSPRRFTLTERLEAEKCTLTDRLAQVDKLLDALAKNPDFQDLFDLISKHA